MSAGLIAGALVGGLGGRIAMFILRLTSDPSLRGLTTDDDFTIGIVLMFIALPGVYGVVTSVLAERFLERSAFFRDSALSFAGPALLLPFALLGDVGILVVGSVGLVLVLSLAGPRLAWIRSSRLVTWLGRAGLASVGMVASIALIRDVTEVL